MSARAFRERLRRGAASVAVDLRLEGGRLRGRVVDGGHERTLDVAVERGADGALLLRHGGPQGRLVRAYVARVGQGWQVSIDGAVHTVVSEPGGAASPAAAGAVPFAVSPMTGLLAQVAVRAGETVAAGAALFVVEAMKMEYVVRAPRALTIKTVLRATGDKVTLGEVVVTFDETP